MDSVYNNISTMLLQGTSHVGLYVRTHALSHACTHTQARTHTSTPLGVIALVEQDS